MVGGVKAVITMAVFKLNNCQFRDCGLNFRTLHDLIIHIEDTHIDFELSKTKNPQQFKCVPMSYILRYNSKAKSVQHDSNDVRPLLRSRTRKRKNSSSEDANRPTDLQMNDDTDLKQYACPVAGCKKRYKNSSGMKYHSQNGHKKNLNQNYTCVCGKIYKTENGLNHHSALQHFTPTDDNTNETLSDCVEKCENVMSTLTKVEDTNAISPDPSISNWDQYLNTCV